MSSILLKSAIDTCISCLSFYLLGWGFQDLRVYGASPNGGACRGERHRGY